MYADTQAAEAAEHGVSSLARHGLRSSCSHSHGCRCDDSEFLQMPRVIKSFHHNNSCHLSCFCTVRSGSMQTTPVD
jgi:hypothetical protein